MGILTEATETLKTAYKIMSDNLSIIWPLVTYMMVIGIFLTPKLALNPIIMLFVFLLSSAFIAGWYPMIDKNINLFFKKAFSKEDKAIEYIKNYKEFFPGVEKNILSMVSVTLISFIFIIIALLVIQLIFKITIGGANMEKVVISLQNSMLKAKTNNEVLALLKNPQYKSLYYLGIIELFFIVICSYLAIFWTQAIILYSKNPFKALAESVKTVINKPAETFIIFSANFIGNTIILISSMFAGENPLFQILSLLATIYISVYLTILNFLSLEKYSKKINSYHRSDCIR